MDKIALQKVLEKHKKWLDGQDGGERADLSNADLSGADLHGADLHGANLHRAHLQGAYLQGAVLNYADLSNADLSGADLCGADLDYSSWPLWCGSLSVRIDKRLAAQLLYHCLRAMDSVDDDEVRAVRNDPKCIALANQFHRADECDEIKESADDVLT